MLETFAGNPSKHEAKKAKLEEAAKAESQSVGTPGAIEDSPGGVKRSEEALSPTSSSPKRWKSDGHMRYKREAEVSLEDLDPRVPGDLAEGDGGETLTLPATSEVVVQPVDATVEDVFARGGDGPSTSSAGAASAPDVSSWSSSVWRTMRFA